MVCPPPLPSPFADAVFHDAVEQSAIAISITDAQARILYVNPAFCAITGYRAEEVIGQKQSVLSYRSTPREVYQAMWEALNAGQAWSGRLLNRRRDGSPYVAELTVTPMRSAGPGSEARFIGMHRDATEAHRLDQQLGNQRRLIESVVAVAPVAVALLDSKGRVVLDNPAYQRIVADMKVAEPAATVLAALRESLGAAYDQACALHRPLINHELRFDRAGGEPRWYACSLSWFEERNPHPDAFYADARFDYQVLVMHDVTASKRQQEALRLAAMRTMLSEGELTQSVREALSGAIFQLQGPVNLISAAASLQRRRAGGGPDPLAQALADAQRAGEAAIATLQAAMPAASVAAQGPVNLNEVVRDVLMLETERFLSAGITVEWTPAHVLPPVQGDPAELRTLLRQLVGNAVEAMNVRGWKERALTIVTSARGSDVEIEVTDTGPGIPEDMRLKVFEPFFSTKKGQGGARGVGLSLAQEIVSRHRGVLGFDPYHEGGCRVRASFPSARATAAEDGR